MFLSFLVVILLLVLVLLVFFLIVDCISIRLLVKRDGDPKRIYLYRRQRKGCIIAVAVVFAALVVCSVFGVRG